jgi:hypothetical protein
MTSTIPSPLNSSLIKSLFVLPSGIDFTNYIARNFITCTSIYTNINIINNYDYKYWVFPTTTDVTFTYPNQNNITLTINYLIIGGGGAGGGGGRPANGSRGGGGGRRLKNLMKENKKIWIKN